MKTFKEFFAVLFLFLFLSCNTGLYAQDACFSAIPFPKTDQSCIDDYQTTSTIIWFSFVAGNVDARVDVTSKVPDAHVHSVSVFASCDDTVPVASDSLRDDQATGLSVSLSGLTAGNTYYIRCSRTVNGCAKCTAPIVFNICVSQLTSCVCATTGAPCDCINAINVCSSPLVFGMTTGPGGTGDLPQPCTFGNPSNGNTCIPPNNNPPTAHAGCLKMGERNVTWFHFTFTSSGTFGFNFLADPSPLSQGTAFDWILYRYNPSNGCFVIQNNFLAPTRCNWNGPWSGGSGMGTMPGGVGANVNNYEAGINVVCGQEYLLCFSNWDGDCANTKLTVTGTASIGCPSSPVITATSSGPICQGQGCATLTATGGTGYTWQPGNLSGSSIVVCPGSTTTYTVTATGTTGCSSASAFITVPVWPLPAVNMTYDTDVNPPSMPGPATICRGQFVLLFSGSTGNSYLWSPGGQTTGFINVTPTTTTTYTVVVTNSNGCTNSGTITVNVIDPPVISLTGTNPTCNGGNNGTATVNFTLINYPPFTYSWSPSGQTTQTATGLSAGTYTVTVTNAYGCSVTSTVTLSQPSPIVVSTGSASFCYGANGTLSALASGGVGPYSYSWSPASGLSPTTGTLVTSSASTTTIYTVTVTDANGCTKTATATATVFQLPDPAITGSITTCEVPAVYCVTFPQGGSVIWNIPSGISYSSQLSGCINITNWGTYSATGVTFSVTITDANGCSSTGSITVQSCCEDQSYPNYINANSATVLSNNPNAFNGTTFYINGIFTVNTNTIFRECKIFFGPSAKIVIPNGNTLQINSQGQTPNCFSHLKAGCGIMWKGIEVNQQGALQVLGLVNIGVLIEDAEAAVTSIGGGPFTLRGAWFNKNYKDVVYLPFTGTHPSSISRSVFTCRDLSTQLTGCPPLFSNNVNIGAYLNTQTTAVLLPPYSGLRSSTGVETNLGGNVTIGVVGTLTTNVFDYHDYGIHASVTNVKVINNRFQNITGPTIQLNIPCPIGTAVCAVSTTIFNIPIVRSLIVGGALNERNEFENCYAGILASTHMNADIRRNLISTMTTSGISVSGCGSRILEIRDNSITDAFAGINVFNCPGSTLNVIRNTVTLSLTNLNNNGRGIWIQDVSPVFGGGTVVTQNNVSEMRFGIRLQNKRAPQVIDNTVTVRNITNSSLFGGGIHLQNCIGGSFVQSNHVFGFAVAPCPLDATCSSSYSCPLGVWWLNGIRVDMSDFSDVQCNDVQDCGDGLFAGGGMPTTIFRNNAMNGNLFRAFIGNWALLNSQGTITNGSDNIWNTLGTFAYKTYNLNPLAPSSGFVNNFRVQSVLHPGFSGHCSNFGALYDFLFFPATGPSGVSCPAFIVGPNPQLPKRIVQDSMSYNSPDSLFVRLVNHRTVYNSISLDPVLSGDPVLSSFHTGFRNTSSGILDSVYRNMVIPMPEADLDHYKSLNLSVNAPDTISHWQKKVNQLALNNIISGENNYTPDQLDRLRFIAQQCPYKYGPVVYEARALLAGVEPQDIEYWSECEIPAPPVGDGRYAFVPEQQLRKGFGKLYPNPSSGDFFIEYVLPENVSGKLSVFNVVGENVLEFTLKTGETTVKVSSSLSNGVYYIIGIMSNGEKFTDKLIINR